MSRSGNSKGKTIIWIIGWILIFPLPLTILICRSGINKKVKIGVIAAAWIAYAVIVATAPKSNKDNNSAADSILAQQGKDDKTTGQSKSSSTTEKPKPSPTPSPTPTPVIEIESIELSVDFEELGLGDRSLVNVKIEPENATDRELTWESSDENVVSIINDGLLTANGGGTATVTATSSNGKSASIEVSVDGSKRTMNLKVSKINIDNNNIGSDWWSKYKINGEETYGGEYTLKVGDKITLYAMVVEDDNNPDVGEGKKTHTVTQDDLINGFYESMDIKVRENGGRYAGVETVWEVTFSFKP